jgi:hypothetical protein
VSVRGSWIAAAMGAFVVLHAGCAVTLYQPMGTLQRPTAVNIDDPNFEDARVLVRCLPSDGFPAADAEKACRQIARSLQQQGAETETIVPRNIDEGLPADAFDGRGAELTVEVSSRTEHSQAWPLLTAASCLTCTMVPDVFESTFVQDVTIRARNQTVLAEETYRARLITYTGCVVWSVNGILDWAFRDDRNDLTSEGAHKAYSRDLYRQIAQLAYNARVRSDLLGLTVPRRRRAPPPPASPSIPAPAAPPEAPAAAAPPPTTTTTSPTATPASTPTPSTSPSLTPPDLLEPPAPLSPTKGP